MNRLSGAALAAALLLGGCATTERPEPAAAPVTPVSGRPTPALATPTSLTPGPVRVVPRAIVPPADTPYPAVANAANATGSGVRAGPPFAMLGATEPEARAALAAFRISCPSLVKRTDRSGLTRPADWQPACTAAASWGAVGRARFLRALSGTGGDRRRAGVRDRIL